MAINQQSITEDRASGAQVIEGSTTFNSPTLSSGQYLKRTPSSSGNQRTWTYSVWFKRGVGTWSTTDEMHLLDAKISSTKNFYGIYIGGNNDGDKLSYWETYGSGTYYFAKQLSAQRDFQGWYHLVFNYDTTQSTSSERIRFFINGVNYGLEPEDGSYPWPAQNYIGAVNSSDANHMIGSYEGSRGFDGQMSNINFIDGQRLDASYFGFTDPLTGTWRPKKYDGATTTSFMWPLASTIVDTFNTVSFTENGGSTSFTSAGTNSFGLSDCADYGAGGKYLSYAIYPAKKWTIDFYVKFDDVTSGSNSYVGGWNGTGGGNCCFGIRKSDSIMSVWGSSNLYSSTVAAVDTWYHIRMTTSGSSDLKLYINGTLSATDSSSDQDPATPLTFGDIQSGRFNGQLAGIRYVPDDLGAPTAGGEVSTGGLLPNVKTIGVNYGINGFHLPLDSSGPIWADQSGLGNNWTTQSLPTTTQVDKATGAFPIHNTVGGGNIIASPIRGEVSIGVTVYNPTGSQDRYYFDGVEAPSYNFARGQNVTFDLGDSTVATHQLKFSTTSDGTHGGGSAYDDGAAYGAISAGTVGSATTITFPHNAENTLYYYCVNHSGMGGSVGLTTDIQKADTYASDCVLAVPLYDDIDGSNWRDLSNRMNPNSAEKTINDNGARCRSGYWHNYGRSCYFDASDDYVSIASGYADLGLGSGAFTIEGWAYTGTDGTLNQVIITSKRYYQGGYNGNWIIRRTNNSQLLFGSFDGTGNDESNQFTCNFSKDDWHHFAFVRNSTGTNGCTMYVDGIDCGNMTVSKDLDDGNTSGIFMGTEHNSGPGDNKWDGFMQDIRIYKGVAKYTSPFIPASPRPAVRSYNPGSSYNKLFKQPTCGSVGFNGANFISCPDDTGLDFSTGDFTIECYINQSSFSDYQCVFGKCSGSSPEGYYIQTGADGILLAGYRFSDSINAPIRTLTTDSWHHCALVRSGSTLSLYVDGRSVGTPLTWAGDADNSEKLRIGSLNGTYPRYFDGSISNFRVVKGTAVYKQNFAPPAKALTAISGTTLLCCNTFDAVGLTTGPSTAVKTGTGFRDSTTATRNWDQSSTSSSRSNALGPDDIFWVDLGETVTLNNVTFDVDSTAGTNLSLTNFQVFYSAASDSTGSGVCYTGGGCGGGEVDASVGGPISGGASDEAITNTVTFDFVSSSVTPPTGIRYVGLTNGSGSYGGSLTYYNVKVNIPLVTNAGTPWNMPSPSAGNPFDNDVDFYQAESSSYATWNPCDNECGNLGEAGLKGGVAGTAGWRHTRATIPLTSGKYYWELYDIGGKWDDTDASNGYLTGYCLGTNGFDIDGQDPNSNSTGLWGRQVTNRYKNNSSNPTAGDFASTAAYSCIAYAYDADTQKLWTSYNGAWECGGNPSAGKIPTWINVTAGGFPMGGSYGSDIYVYANFGQKPFRYQPPKGFGPVCSSNVKRPAVAKSTDYVGLSSYVGNGSNNSVSDLNFKPDLLWVKDTDDGDNWITVNSVIGIEKMIKLNEGETSYEETGDFTSFDDKGYSFGLYNNINQSGITYTGYAWKAGGNSNTFNIDDVGYATAAAAGLTGGDITPTGASINTKAGFSIISYVGTGNDGDTVAHGLTKEPAFVMVKKFEENGNWGVYHQGLSSNVKVLTVNSTNAEFTPTDKFFTWSSTTTDLLGLGFNTITNDNTEGTVAYLWADIPGLQKFGSYRGNGGTGTGQGGAYVELGFRPALVIVKKINSTGNWMTFDNVRCSYNINDNYYYLNTPAATTHDNGNGMDFLANGFKCRGNLDDANQNDATYVYMAWAESPFHNLYGATGTGGS